MTKLALVSASLTITFLSCRNSPTQGAPPTASSAAVRPARSWSEPAGFRLDLRVPIDLPSDPTVSPAQPERKAVSEWWAREVDARHAECVFVSDVADEPEDPFLPDGGVLRVGEPFLFFGTSGVRQGLQPPELVKLKNGRAVFAAYEGTSHHECRVRGIPPSQDVRALLFRIECDQPASSATGFWIRPDGAAPSSAELVKLLRPCE